MLIIAKIVLKPRTISLLSRLAKTNYLELLEPSYHCMFILAINNHTMGNNRIQTYKVSFAIGFPVYSPS